MSNDTYGKFAVTNLPKVVELKISGMTCTSCAVRIEKRLQKVANVDNAAVNFATEVATVRLAEPVGKEDEILSELIKAVESAGYEADLYEEKAVTAEQKNQYIGKLILAVILLIPIVLLSFAPSLRFPAWEDIVLAASALVVFYSGWPFHKATVANLKHFSMTMDTLVSLGSVSALVWSAVVTFADINAPVYFDEAAGITAVILLGRFLEDRIKKQASNILGDLFALGIKDAEVLRGTSSEVISIENLRPGDIFVVKPGGKIAADGVVVSGVSAVDSSLVTGESMPVEVGVGSHVVGGTINTYGSLHVEAQKTGQDGVLAEIGRLVAEAQGKKANIQKLADRISAVFIPIVLSLSLLSFAVWLAFGYGLSRAFIPAVAVLVVACPCAMGLATPIAMMVGIGRGARLGILIKDPDALENSRKVTAVVFDKTGTITSGAITVDEIVSFNGHTGEEVLSLAASLEKSSEHLIGQAIYNHALKEGTDLVDTDEFVSAPGEGIEANIGSIHVMLGKKTFLLAKGISISQDMVSAEESFESQGKTVISVAADGVGMGLISLSDTVKAEAKSAIDRVKSLGIRPIMITGDNEAVAHNIAKSVGIDEVIAGVMPKDKASKVHSLQSAGEVVAMVGDGINDAPALASADLSIAVGSGTDAALAVASITLVKDDLMAVPDAILLSRKTFTIIKSNLGWAFGYNVVAIPLAASGIINPLISAAFMSFSSIFVVLNALRLKRFKGESHGGRKYAV